MTNATIKTRLVTYRFNVADSSEAAAYGELRSFLRGEGIECFNVYAETRRDKRPSDLETGPVVLETKHVFHNQWNTSDAATDQSEANAGQRVFDWYEGIYPNKSIKEGHYLEITGEMQELRARRHACGYCGNQQDNPADKFCGKCIGSEFLKEENLPLLRFTPVASGFAERQQLSADEHQELKERFDAAQLVARKARQEKRREDTKKDLARKLEAAQVEHDGLMWLIEKAGMDTENCIYYGHTGKFCFGWREALSEAEKAKLADKLANFPFEWETK